MDDLISRKAAIEAMQKLEAEDIETYGVSIPEGFDGERAAEALKALPAIMQMPSGAVITDETFDFCSSVERMQEKINEIINSPELQTSRIEQELHGKTPEEQYEFLYWLMFKFGQGYTDSRLAIIDWLKGDKGNG